MTIPFFVRVAGAWVNVESIWHSAATQPNFYGGRGTLRLKLPSHRWATYYERAYIDGLLPYGGPYLLPDEGVYERPLFLRHKGKWLRAGSLATGNAILTVLPVGVYGDAGGSFVSPDTADDPADLGDISFGGWQASANHTLLSTVIQTDHVGLASLRRTWLVVDMAWLQQITTFYDGYIDFSVSGWAEDAVGFGYLHQSGLSTDVSGVTQAGWDGHSPQQDWLSFQQTMRGLSHTAAAAESLYAGTVLHTWDVGLLEPPWGWGGGGAPPGWTPDPGYRYPIDHATAVSGGTLIFRTDLTNPGAPDTTRILTCEPRIVLRS